MADSSAVILNRMLSDVDPSYDTSNGSFFYDLNAPVSIELNSIYKEIENIITNRNVETSTGDDLTELCSEMGVDKKTATQSSGAVLIKGNPGTTIPQGERVSNGLVNFIFTDSAVIPEIGEISVNVKCETYGIGGNVPANTIVSFPKTLTGVTAVTNPQAMTGGYDEETEESLRERYYIKVRTPATSGNKYHYLSWAREVQGVSMAKVKPLWNGRGTVKVVIADSNKRAVTPQLITDTFNHIEDVRPIGAIVTVSSVTEKSLNITGNVTLAVGYNLGDVQENFTTLVTEYLESVAFTIDFVSLVKIGSILLDSGIVDYSDLKINGSTSKIPLTDEEIAVFGSVNLGVI